MGNQNVNANTPLVKKCSICKTEKTLDCFYKCKRYKYGVTRRCKDCLNIRARAEWKTITYPKRLEEKKAYRSKPEVKAREAKRYLENKDEYAASNKRRYLANPEPAILRAITYNKTHPVERSKTSKKYRKNNIEKVRECGRRWVRKNMAKMCAYAARRRARKARLTIGDQSYVDAFYVMVKAVRSIRCYWCGKRIPKGKRTVDHIMPFDIHNGAHAIENLCCSCGPCNSAKKNKLPEVFSGQYEMFTMTVPPK